jgi:hypothetical protein
MMSAILQIFYIIRFKPAIQSPFSQDQYSVALGFKPPTYSLKALMLPHFPPFQSTIIPPPSLSRISINCFFSSQAKSLVVLLDVEENVPMPTQGKGVMVNFAQTEQIGQSKDLFHRSFL